MPRTRLSSSTSPLEVRRRRRTNRLSGDDLAGCIRWLPKKDDIDQCLLAGTNIDEGCFHHPVVILSTDDVERKATVLIVSIETHNLRSHLHGIRLTLQAYFLRWPRSYEEVSE